MVFHGRFSGHFRFGQVRRRDSRPRVSCECDICQWDFHRPNFCRREFRRQNVRTLTYLSFQSLWSPPQLPPPPPHRPQSRRHPRAERSPKGPLLRRPLKLLRFSKKEKRTCREIYCGALLFIQQFLLPQWWSSSELLLRWAASEHETVPVINVFQSRVQRGTCGQGYFLAEQTAFAVS